MSSPKINLNVIIQDKDYYLEILNKNLTVEQLEVVGHKLLLNFKEAEKIICKNLVISDKTLFPSDVEYYRFEYTLFNSSAGINLKYFSGLELYNCCFSSPNYFLADEFIKIRLSSFNNFCAEKLYFHSSLRFLQIENCDLPSIKYFPPLLEEIHLSYNKLKVLPLLPHNLLTLQASNNSLLHLPPLPTKLKVLIVAHNLLEDIQYFPPTLEYINISDNRIRDFIKPFNQKSYDNLYFVNIKFNQSQEIKLDDRQIFIFR